MDKNSLLAGIGAAWVCLAMSGQVRAQDVVPAAPAALAPEPAASEASQASAALSWGFVLPEENALVPFRGAVNHDTTGLGAGAMLYPAVGGIGGLIAAVVTHGVLVESAKNSQKTQLQEAANRVLQPYESVLGGFRQHDLMQQALNKARTPGPKKLATMPTEIRHGRWIQCAPQFLLTQDHRAVVLENAVTVATPGRPEPFKAVIKVVSLPAKTDAPTAWWGEAEGARLKGESAGLLAESVDIALALARQEAAGAVGQAVVHKTVRYPEGGVRKMERAEVLSQTCERLLIRNLRGDLMSVPLLEPADSCLVAAQAPVQP
ncbi:hypothetical protein EIP75_04215 [Aquabacterium soli]|uniref:Uncharacterized protein n=1 Tax=Aquabacterium soli TaxID=2493092 RepID=A0A3R8T6S3_9BURK|nr:hypothetical protein [Aquabacterium soli]RRS05422.1 hypothetical protein EIP75_04215 [Aquabacterium soli]